MLPLEGVGMFSILLLIFAIGHCSGDLKWDGRCEHSRPFVINGEVYLCTQVSRGKEGLK
jgi:hypothetical protein